ncbi:GGDEF domain-containing protein [Xanthobacter sp. DSM 24535]|uniref:GGDEF domain-containing protein n=1 Tax=Roseixanthobacter psychrophilus TaxID=3119917 RepID=UPI00372AE751
MDPRLALLIAALLMLSNGGMLGLMFRDLPANLRPAVISWELGTLLIAAGCATFALDMLIPYGAVIFVANCTIIMGLTFYLRALRQFYGRPDRLVLVLPAALGTIAIIWFAFVDPNTLTRILLVSAAWVTLMGASWKTLLAQSGRDNAMSRKVLTGIFGVIIVFVIFRAVYFTVEGIPEDYSVVDTSSWLNLATPMLATVLPVSGTTAFVLMCSERIRRQLERMASTDYLTGLANRRTLMDAGTLLFAAARVRKSPFALALIDVDDFKTINDRHGHEIGDLALKHVAESLQANTRDSEMLARLGGEEFVVLLADMNAAQAKAYGERLRQAVLDRPFVAGASHLTITVSIGVAIYRPDDGDFDVLMRRADLALYAAKARGRNCVEINA